MSLIRDMVDRIRTNHREVNTRSATMGSAIIPWTAGKPQWLRPSIERFDRDAYRKVVLAFRCIQYLSNATGSAPIRLYDPATEEVDDAHPLRDLLVHPNAGMGEARFLSFVAMVMAVAGFCVIEKERDRAGNVIGLWPLRSDWLRVIPRQHGQPDWEYRVPGWQEPFLLPAEDAIPITFADAPDGSPLGIGPTELMLREAQVSSALTDFLKVFMDRGALPLYAIIPQDQGPGAAQWTKQETKDAVVEAFQQRYGGLQNAGNALPLVGVKDVKPIGLNFDELAYPELNDLTDSRICSAYGVPPILVGAQVGLDRATYSNYEQARQSFYEDTMSAVWGRIDDAFTRHLLPEFEYRPGWDIRFDTSNVRALQDNQNEVWQRSTSAFQAGGISRHVYHRLIGIDPHGPDEILQPFNVIPLTVATGTRSQVTGRVHEAAFEVLPIRAGLPAHDPTAPRYVFRDGRRYVNFAAMTAAERQHRSAVQTTNQNSITALARLLDRPVAAFLTAQRDRVLEQLALRALEDKLDVMVEASLANARSKPVVSAALSKRFAEAVNWANEDDLLLRIFSQWWDDASELARQNASSLLGLDIDWNVVNPYIADVQGVLGDRIAGINLTTRIDIEDRLTELMGKGTTPQEMADSIAGLFDETYKNRSMTIARTESMVGYAEASAMAYEASGVVQRVQIMDNATHTESYPGAEDGLTCAQRDGLVVPLSRGTYHIRSDHPNGSASMMPIVAPLGEV